MLKLELSQECLHSKNEQLSLKHPKGKQNESKYLNAIKPYVRERHHSKKEMKNSLNDSKGKKGEQQCRIKASKSSNKMQNLCSELMNLKSQYHALKDSYNTLIKQKLDENSENRKCTSEEKNQYCLMIENLQKHNRVLSSELEKVTRQHHKAIEAEKNRSQKLQETIQEKELMIAYLRSQLKQRNSQSTKPFQNPFDGGFFPQLIINQSLPANQLSAVGQNLTYFSEKPCTEPIPKQISMPFVSSIKNAHEEDSLSFSIHEKHGQSILSENDPTILTFTKKDVIIIDHQPNEKKKSPDQSGEDNLPTFENRFKKMKVCSLPPQPVKKSSNYSKKNMRAQAKMSEQKKHKYILEKKIKNKKKELPKNSNEISLIRK